MKDRSKLVQNDALLIFTATYLSIAGLILALFKYAVEQ